MIESFTPIQPLLGASIPCPVYMTQVPAGFPSPADDYMERHLDLNEYLIARPAATYFVRVKGEAMEGAGIFNGDLLIVDKSLKPTSGCVVLAVLNGEITVRRLQRNTRGWILFSENSRLNPVFVGDELEIWGVVTSVVHSF